MALSDTKLRNLKPADKAYQEADEGGLFVEGQPGGTKTFRLRYRIGGPGAKQEKVTLGDYPTYALAEARTWRDDCKALAGRGMPTNGGKCCNGGRTSWTARFRMGAARSSLGLSGSLISRRHSG